MVCSQSHTCKLGSMIGLVLCYFIVELVVGNALHSITLVADSFHMLSDFIALVIGIAARRISKWPKSNKNTFGWQRAEVVGSLLNTVMLTTLTFTIFIETIQRFIKPESIEKPKLLLGVGAGGLLINIIGLIILRGQHGHQHGNTSPVEVIINEDHDQIDKTDENYVEEMKRLTVADNGDKVDDLHNHENNIQENSHAAGYMNLRAVFLHVLADFFGSVAVVVSALIIWLVPNYTDNKNGDTWKNYIDPSISLLMVVFILISTIPLLKKSSLILLQSVPKEISVTKLKQRIETIDGIDKVHDLHVWQLQSDVIIGTVHIRCVNENYVTVSKKVKKIFHDFNIHCTTIQAEFNEHDDSNSYESIENRSNDDCILFCGDKSTLTGINECKGKQYCCPTKNVTSVSPNVRMNDPDVVSVDPAVVSVDPALKQRLSAPCLISMESVTDRSAMQLENIIEK